MKKTKSLTERIEDFLSEEEPKKERSFEEIQAEVERRNAETARKEKIRADNKRQKNKKAFQNRMFRIRDERNSKKYSAIKNKE